MKFLPSQLIYFLQTRETTKKIRTLLKFVLLLVFLITTYSLLFHFLMEYEGRRFSWITGFYWTLTVMSTLGFGDITFTSDLGRVFSIVVLLSGILLLLIMLPFTFITFFYAPWLEAQSKLRVPRELPEEFDDHVIFTSFDPITISLVERLRHYQRPYVILTPDIQHALDLIDQGYNVVVGDLDDPEAYRRLRVSQAAMVVANNDDMKNTNITFTIREITTRTPIVTNADLDESIDILHLAGSTQVFQFMKMLGQALARRALGISPRANVIGRFDRLLIAEAAAMRTPLVGKTLQDSGIRQATGINVVGLWEQGQFQAPRPQSLINPTTVLVLAGSEEQLADYDRFMEGVGELTAPILILGGGRVGRAAAEALEERGLDFRIIENNPDIIEGDDRIIQGSAADLHTLIRAGIKRSPSVFITTHTDDLNIYLTIYCRRLRPDVQIISRATLDRNISILHTAGANLVMSAASLAANTIFNLLISNKVLMISEGLNIFRVKTHPSLAGKTLRASKIREETGCTLIAVQAEGKMRLNPDPDLPLKAADELFLIGTGEAEKLFLTRYPEVL
ncbi:MAG: potassium channel protein [Deltaproteobacteria bacterium]|nr:potassium channel protein [Deltaproteobacteria bacterium]